MREQPVLLIGATGQMGQALAPRLTRYWPVVAPSRATLDLARPNDVRRVVRDVAPSLIINAAAFTAVDEAERAPDRAKAVNATAPGLLAEEAMRRDIPIVHYSTDYVFGSPAGGAPRRARKPYREVDATSPVNTYGQTKLAGEKAVVASGAQYLILRLSWVYSRSGRNFLNAIRTFARLQPEIRVVADQVGSPTWADAIANATVRVLAEHWRGGSADFEAATGLYHLAANGATSRYDLAREIVDTMGAATTILPVSSRDMPIAAPRPDYSVLDTGKLARHFGIRLPDWREQLRTCLDAWHAAETELTPTAAVPR